jgi:ribulose-phosphate 3-epimerase
VDAGADLLVVHAEACEDLAGTVSGVKAHGARVGVAIRPDTSVDVLLPLLGDIDLALVMSVIPGWSGQKYMAEVEGKVVALRRLIDERGLATELEMDGGIDEETAPRAASAGADVLVAGSAVFGRAAPVAERIETIRGAASSIAS